jgi:hypothetical protein
VQPPKPSVRLVHMSTRTSEPEGAGRVSESSNYSASELLPIVYEELRKLAVEKMKHERPGQTLTPTALVHEAYLRLVASGQVKSGGDQASEDTSPQSRPWSGQTHFMAAAAEAMRRILVDQARRRGALKRGGKRQREALHDQIAVPAPDVDLLALNDVLTQLEASDPQKATLVKLMHFAGLTIPEAAAVLGVSLATAERWWAYSRAWLFDRLKDAPDESPRP